MVPDRDSPQPKKGVAIDCYSVHIGVDHDLTQDRGTTHQREEEEERGSGAGSSGGTSSRHGIKAPSRIEKARVRVIPGTEKGGLGDQPVAPVWKNIMDGVREKTRV